MIGKLFVDVNNVWPESVKQCTSFINEYYLIIDKKPEIEPYVFRDWDISIHYQNKPWLRE